MTAKKWTNICVYAQYFVCARVHVCMCMCVCVFEVCGEGKKG